MESFVYQYPVKNYFGEGAMEKALRAGDAAPWARQVMLAYGGGSIKRDRRSTTRWSALLDEARARRVVDFGGIMSQPHLREGARRAPRVARENARGLHSRRGRRLGVRLLQGRLGPGQARRRHRTSSSACRAADAQRTFIPLGCIVTLSGTGAEQNSGRCHHRRGDARQGPARGVPCPCGRPSIRRSPSRCPRPQFMSGAFDSLSHCMETYFGTPARDATSPTTSTSPSSATSSATCAPCAADEHDMDARSELVYDSAMGENGVLKIGKVGDFQCAHDPAPVRRLHPHQPRAWGSPSSTRRLYRHLAPEAPEQFARWAVEVWGVDAERQRRPCRWPTRASMTRSVHQGDGHAHHVC